MATNPMSLTAAKVVAKYPHAHTNEELDDALTAIVDSPDLTERQVTNLQAKIDPVLRARLAGESVTEDGRPTAARIVHLAQSDNLAVCGVRYEMPGLTFTDDREQVNCRNCQRTHKFRLGA